MTDGRERYPGPVRVVRPDDHRRGGRSGVLRQGRWLESRAFRRERPGVHDVGRPLRVGTDPADARTDEVGVDGHFLTLLLLGDDVAPHVEGFGAVDVEGGGFVLFALQLRKGAGEGVQVVEDFVLSGSFHGSSLET